MPQLPVRVAVVGAGPAGIYASELLVKSSLDVQVDVIERLPAPFGLIRYGVAPDHPRIKGIIKALHRVMDRPEIRLLGNVEVGKDVTVEELHDYYDAIVFATGATQDRDLQVPGTDLDGFFGAASLVGFYDGNPDFARTWDVSAEKVAVVGVGNVALDISRVLAKTADELHVTEIPDNVYQTLQKNQAREVHIFGRRGPAQAKFSPLELKELDLPESVQVIVDPEDIDYDEASITARRESKSVDLVCQTLEHYAMREEQGNPHKIYIHFFESPVEILGEEGHVTGFKTERTQLNGDGTVSGTGEFAVWPVEAVYSAVGYRSKPLPSLPWDTQLHVFPNDGGHIINPDGTPLPGLYATGWVKRGPVGLIGNTKSDAKTSIEMLVKDWDSGALEPASRRELEDFPALLRERGVDFTTWEGWHNLDAAERAAGEAEGRERKKYVEWEDMLEHSRGQE